MMPVRAAAVLAAGLLSVPQPSTLPADVRDAAHRLREVEDARAARPGDREALLAGLRHPDVGVRLQATRAAGRLEQPSLAVALAAVLSDVSIEVRAEAAHALGQSATTGAAAEDVRQRLSARLVAEADAGVRGAIATSLGRLPYGPLTPRATVAATLSTLLEPSAPATPVAVLTLLGVGRGAAALARHCGRLPDGCDRPAVALLDRLLHLGGPAADPAPAPVVGARLRRLAAMGLASANALHGARRDALIADPDPQVRRIAVLAAVADPAITEAEARPWLADPSFLVRHAVIRGGGARLTTVARAALDDEDLHVRLAAIDALGAARACDACVELVEAHPPVDRWHVPAHALVALARTDSARATQPLSRAAGSQVWQVRMYAARAAAETGDIALLRRLGRDMHPNVREAALAGLAARGHRESDDLRREALESGDYQLVLTAARTLEGTPASAEARAALLAALTRLTSDRRDTSRDPRLALVDRLAEVSGSEELDALRQWLHDADPVVAARVAEVLPSRTGEPAVPAPAASAPRQSVPTEDDITQLDGQTVTLTMHDEGEVVIRLAAREAPLNVARFVRQVDAGDWDGLTFHRVEPGFVVQGGSPGANEYVGAARYTRDERSHLSHVRGTVGISTRGRDTGDGQIFVNLVDNPRLDHAYTVIGTVVSGMDVVDGLLEGAVIVRARVTGR